VDVNDVVEYEIIFKTSLSDFTLRIAKKSGFHHQLSRNFWLQRVLEQVKPSQSQE
jgi:hypothetical protein